MRNKRKLVKKGSLCLTCALVASQLLTVISAGAEELEWEGTTQISTNEYTLDVDTFAVSLTVEEVYAQAGDSLSDGDQILKVTDDSYEEAITYYEVAIQSAKNSLTDTQLEYDQGILASQYTYEESEAAAESAEFVKEYQTNEVSTAMTEHEQALEDIDDRIEELEEGIADGSYDSSSSSTSASSASGSSGGGSGAKQAESKSESETESETQTQPETESEVPGGDGQQSGAATDQQPETEPSSESTDTKSAQELKAEIRTKTAETQTLAESITEKLKGLAEELDGSSDNQDDYAAYAQQLENLIDQLESDIKAQENVKAVLDASGDSESSEVLEDSISGDTRVKDSLTEIQTKLSKYSALISAVLKVMDTSTDQMAVIDEETLTEIQSYLKKEQEISALYTSLTALYEQQISTLESEAQSSTENSTNQTGSTADTDAQLSTGDGFPGSTDQTDSQQTASGELSGMAGGSFSGMSGGASSGSMPSGGGSTGTASSSDVSTAQGSTGNADAAAGAQMGTSSLSGDDISLLGDDYDLTEVETLLSREPSDSDGAEDLIEELEDAKDDVETQYAELQRKQKVFELKIQYTYDTAVINAKLAEITYQQELEDWEETLAEAKEKVTDLESQKTLLDQMSGGVITADRSGTVASVSYEAEDTLSSSVLIISYYNTDELTITLEVSQEDIAKIAVGDTVEVTLSGYGSYDGTVTEKSTEAEEGTSRTTVNYTVTVTVDNADGRLSAGTAATVTFDPDAVTESEAETETEAATEAVTESAAETATEADAQTVTEIGMGTEPETVTVNAEEETENE